MAVITLTTDFGTADWFVGTMKGVIVSIAPRATVVDITHDIPPGDIRACAFALAAGCRFFPKGTIHVAVVDPGVGSQRSAIIVQTKDYLFIGPDNGVLSFVLNHETVRAVHRITKDEFFLKPLSATFHGRDVFAPVAAHLSRRTPIERLGPRLKHYVRLDWAKARRVGKEVRGEVVYIDRFGNAITNIDGPTLSGLPPSVCEVFVKRNRLCTLSSHYQAVPRGEAVAVINSCNLLEIAVSGGSAANSFRLKTGTAVSVRSR